jgi:hypothetical protein
MLSKISIFQYYMEGSAPGIEQEFERFQCDGKTPIYIILDPQDDIVYYVSHRPFTLDEARTEHNTSFDEGQENIQTS